MKLPPEGNRFDVKSIESLGYSIYLSLFIGVILQSFQASTVLIAFWCLLICWLWRTAPQVLWYFLVHFGSSIRSQNDCCLWWLSQEQSRQIISIVAHPGSPQSPVAIVPLGLVCALVCSCRVCCYVCSGVFFLISSCPFLDCCRYSCSSSTCYSFCPVPGILHLHYWLKQQQVFGCSAGILENHVLLVIIGIVHHFAGDAAALA